MRILKTKNTNGTLWCPISLECSDLEEKIIVKLHKLLYGTNWYIADSIGGSQVLYIMFENLPFSWFVKLFIPVDIKIVDNSGLNFIIDNKTKSLIYKEKLEIYGK